MFGIGFTKYSGMHNEIHHGIVGPSLDVSHFDLCRIRWCLIMSCPIVVWAYLVSHYMSHYMSHYY